MKSASEIFQDNIVNKSIEIELFNGLLTICYQNNKISWEFINAFRDVRNGIEPCTYLQINSRMHILFWYDPVIDGHISYTLDMETNKLRIISSHIKQTHGGKRVSIEIYSGSIKQH